MSETDAMLDRLDEFDHPFTVNEHGVWCDACGEYVDQKAVRSINPGYCFVAAGWRKCGMTKSGLKVFERLSPAETE